MEAGQEQRITNSRNGEVSLVWARRLITNLSRLKSRLLPTLSLGRVLALCKDQLCRV
jgi:hypothetical protein